MEDSMTVFEETKEKVSEMEIEIGIGEDDEMKQSCIETKLPAVAKSDENVDDSIAILLFE
jgi:hypothetical protein